LAVSSASISTGIRTSEARGAECLTAPGSDSGGWYYRTNRETGHKCWHQRGADTSDDKPSKQNDQKPADPAPAAQAPDDAPAQAAWRHLPNPVSDQELTQDQTECAKKGNDSPVGAGSPEFKFFMVFSECMHAAGYAPIAPQQ
jgi:hypothetical protein